MADEARYFGLVIPSCDKCSFETVLQWLFWFLYVGSTVVIVICMVIADVPLTDETNDDTIWWCFLNLNIFSFGLNMLYIYPWFFYKKYTLFERFERATMNWIALSTFEEIFFQITHLFVQGYIASEQDSNNNNNVIEYPYFVYSLCDSRWNYYGSNKRLLWEIETNNFLEGFSGLTIVVILLFERYLLKLSNHIKTVMETENIVDYKPFPHSLAFILAAAFRDAMLFRQTISYFTDQATEDYPFTISDSKYRTNGILGLYFINILWIIAPFSTMIWGYAEIRRRWTRTLFAGKLLEMGKITVNNNNNGNNSNVVYSADNDSIALAACV